MKKYLAVVRIALAQTFEYRWEFLINQLRVVIILLTLYFLWTQVYQNRPVLFGFDYQKIISYLLLAMILRQTVFSSVTEQIAAELQVGGKFFTYLLRPIGFFRYWLTIDLAYKLVNLIFIILIVGLFIKIFHLPFFEPAGVLPLGLFLISLVLALLTYFYLGILVSSTGFWTSQVWGLQFLTVLILEFSAGAYFPIDVLPEGLRRIIQLTPFPYLLYYPVSIFLGRLSLLVAAEVIAKSFFWLILIFLLTRVVWQKGLKTYEAWGG